MYHKPIQLIDLGFFLPHKTCFEDFNVQIPYGARIALIGQNGSGKSTLLKILQAILEPSSGNINVPPSVNIGYVPQIIETDERLSGGERFNKALSEVLETEPNVLLLDEPTNHLDRKHRQLFLNILKAYAGTLIIASHDIHLLINYVDILWHIDNGKIHVFSGNYKDYMNEQVLQQASIEKAVEYLKKQKKEMHQALMKEQSRAATSRTQGEKNITQRKWPTVVSKTKVGRANKTSDKMKASIGLKKQALIDKLSNFKIPEIIVPKFDLTSSFHPDRVLVSIRAGLVGYKNSESVLANIDFSIKAKERVAIMGNNGAGKSTLVKAMLGAPDVLRSGEWFCPSMNDIGYLDQHYQNFQPEKTVFDIIQECVPGWDSKQLRRFLSDFLFRKNEEVNVVAGRLSGGEKARLSLAMIAAKTPKLMILDEITNNLDLMTRGHVIQVLKHYPGAMIIISHDEAFLQAIDIRERYVIKNRRLERE